MTWGVFFGGVIIMISCAVLSFWITLRGKKQD